MRTILRLVLLVSALVLAPLAHAAYSCSVSSGGVAVAYSPSAPGTTVVQTSFTVTCTRALSDGATMSYSVAADNGAHAQGTHNRAAFGASLISYDLFKDAACGTQWRGPQSIAGSLAFGGSTAASTTVTFYGCIPSGQNVPSGTYIDSVAMTLTYGSSPQSTAPGTIGVSIGTPATCSLTSPPGNVVFDYVGFGAAANASTTFGVTCTTYLPYSMALDATSGTILGVNYTLALSAPSATGNGAQQSYTISGNIAAGQGGTCASGSCSASQARTLTITY
jgi:spore coat protein U-like protein